MSLSILRNAVAEALEVEPQALTPDVKFEDLEEYDSLAAIKMMVALDAIGVNIDPGDVSKLKSFGDLLRLAGQPFPDDTGGEAPVAAVAAPPTRGPETRSPVMTSKPMQLGRRFQDCVVVVTGAGTGIGFATAKRIADEGGRVALLGRRKGVLDDARGQLSGGGHLVRACDATQAGAVNEAVSEIAREMGNLHAAVACAGKHTIHPFSISTSEQFRSSFDENVLTAANLARAFLGPADPQGASIVFVSSVAGYRATPGVAPYSCAKGALLALTKTLAAELASKRIRVNVVVPGVVQTPTAQGFLGSLPEPQRVEIEKRHPLGLGAPEDVAAAIAFLASRDARWITGTHLVVDGGLTSS